MELDPLEGPGEIKSREVELGSHDNNNESVLRAPNPHRP